VHTAATKQARCLQGKACLVLLNTLRRRTVARRCGGKAKASVRDPCGPQRIP